MNIYKLLLLLIIFFFPKSAFLQNIEFTIEDDNFFQSKIPRYEKWLESYGFNQLLKVHEIDTDYGDTSRVTLILKTNFVDADTSYSIWKEIKNQYDRKSPYDSLEIKLFKHFCNLMQIPFNHGVIEIYNNINQEEIPCFNRYLYYDDLKGFIVDSDNCMNIVKPVVIDNISVSNNRLISSVKIENPPSKKVTKAILEKEIKAYIKNYYVTKFNVEPDFLIPQRGKLVKYEIMHIKNEVLTDESNFLLAEWLNKCCSKNINWVANEFITTEIGFELEGNSLVIIVDMNGKYGFGVMKPRRSGYMDMEPEFEEYLETYVEKFAEQLKKALISDTNE